MNITLASSPPSGNSTVLAADIGGTKTNMAFYKWDGINFEVHNETTYQTGSFPGVIALIHEFLQGNKLPDKISLGVAGPVTNGVAKITNVPWEINSAEVSREFNVPVSLLNDLEATAHGLAALKKEDIITIFEGSKEASGNVAVIAPGTGLGEAGLYWDGKSYQPFATEGGHSDFSPRSETDIDLYLYLTKKYGHVSWERLVSGPGIYEIYEFLHTEKGWKVPEWISEKMLKEDHSAVISESVVECEICAEVMNMFFRYLATESGNLVLKLKATGGLFIGGGIITKIHGLLDKDLFLKWFCDFGRFQNLLRDVPVTIILNEKTALLGAAVYAVHK